MQWTLIWLRSLLLGFFLFTSGFNALAASKKIISASPSVTEMIYFLGAEKQLLARTDYCKYPAAAIKLPSTGSPYQFNFEKAKSLGVDTVISVQTSLITFKKRIKQMGIELVEVQTRSADDLFSALEKISKILSIKNVDSKILSLRIQLNSLSKAVANGSFVYIHALSKKNGRLNGLYIAGVDSIYGDFGKRLGLENISKLKGQESHFLALEDLLILNPKYILWGVKPERKEGPLTRLSGKHLEFLDSRFQVPGPGIISLLKSMKQRLEHD